jgi:hypothetical protein
LLPEVPYRPKRPEALGQDSGKTAYAAIPDYSESNEEVKQNE